MQFCLRTIPPNGLAGSILKPDAEGSMKKRIWIALAVIVLVGLTYWLARQISIDKCLDGGGAWNYDESRCIGSQSNK